jgi:hypothetical protein
MFFPLKVCMVALAGNSRSLLLFACSGRRGSRRPAVCQVASGSQRPPRGERHKKEHSLNTRESGSGAHKIQEDSNARGDSRSAQETTHPRSAAAHCPLRGADSARLLRARTMTHHHAHPPTLRCGSASRDGIGQDIAELHNKCNVK